MDDRAQRHDQLLLLLVANLQQGALVQLGKLADPATGETAVNLEAARLSIDLLDMLREKTRAATDAAIMREVDRIVMDLQLNYADVARREQEAAAGEGGGGETATGRSADEEKTAPSGEEHGGPAAPAAEAAADRGDPVGDAAGGDGPAQ